MGLVNHEKVISATDMLFYSCVNKIPTYPNNHIVKLEHNGWYNADNIVKCIFFNEKKNQSKQFAWQ